MTSLKITLDFDTEGGTTYGDLRRFVELTESVPDYYPIEYIFDFQSTEDQIVGLYETGKRYGEESQWPATTPE